MNRQEQKIDNLNQNTQVLEQIKMLLHSCDEQLSAISLMQKES